MQSLCEIFKYSLSFYLTLRLKAVYFVVSLCSVYVKFLNNSLSFYLS